MTVNARQDSFLVWRDSSAARSDYLQITTPEKFRPLQATRYRNAKAQPDCRFWSLGGALTRRDLLEQTLRLVTRNGGAPGVDGESLSHITATGVIRWKGL